MTINEVYKKRVNKMICEEYGISDKLHYDIIPRFVKQLKSSIKNTGFATSTHFKEGEFEFNCCDDKNTIFKVRWLAYFFNNIDEYNNHVKKYSTGLNYVMYDFKMFRLTLFYIDGKPVNNEMYDTIGHEFEHVYQNILMGKQFGNKKIYAIAISNVFSKNRYDRNLARIIYASTKSEQEGFINGFYSQFVNGDLNTLDIDKEIENSECGVWLKNLYDDYMFLKEHNDENMQEAIKKYKNIKDYYNYKYFLYMARNGIKNLERRIARLTYKIKKDIYIHSEPKLNEDFNPLNNFFLIQ
jgi:hypothetical protein